MVKQAFFSRVKFSTSYSSLEAESKQQFKFGHKPIMFEIISDIFLDKEEFEKVMNNVSTPLSQYRVCCRDSITSPQGVWRCIAVKCSSDKRAIAVYTAGRTFPLYAAPISHENIH